MKKIIFTCPAEESKKLRLAVWDAGAGKFGNYSHCCFLGEVKGHFKPCEWATPTIWEVDSIKEVLEHKVEVTCEDSELESIIKVIKENHSYETPWIEIHNIELIK